ncbi:MAG: hypothetical protein KGN34_17490 [Sphingomonadales bacterium]|nr:hypothetical protein [Sphingomonadales bacterium]
MVSIVDHRSRQSIWQPNAPLDPCRRLSRFGPVQPMPQPRTLLQRLLFG